jgi:hypothetical protein
LEKLNPKLRHPRSQARSNQRRIGGHLLVPRVEYDKNRLDFWKERPRKAIDPKE